MSSLLCLMIKDNYFFFFYYYSQKDAWRDVTFSGHRLIDEASHFPEMITDHNLELWTVRSFQNHFLSLFPSCRISWSDRRLAEWKATLLVYISLFISSGRFISRGKCRMWVLSVSGGKKIPLAYELVWQGSGKQRSSKNQLGVPAASSRQWLMHLLPGIDTFRRINTGRKRNKYPSKNERRTERANQWAVSGWASWGLVEREIYSIYT